MKTFHKLLAYSLVASTTNNFIWFALTFFAYLQTRSVVSTAFVGGIYLVATALSGFWFGSLVDSHKKKSIMFWSSVVTLAFFSLAIVVYYFSPPGAFTSVSSPFLWTFAFVLMGGVVSGNLIGIVVPTLVTHLIPAQDRDKANGLSGTIMGISFAITSVASGLVLGFLGMTWVLILAIALTFVAITILTLIAIPEKDIIHTENSNKNIDIKGTLKVIKGIPGLLPLLLFATFNNFLGGVFMALMDAYGLTLVSVQVWGVLWGVVSFGFIIGGIFIAKKGLGKNPLHTLLLINVITWTVCIFFTIQPSIVLLFLGTLTWMALVPFIEATEQTVIQKVVPPERQGRVFGFSQSIEQAASPLTAFMIGPIAQFIFIPFMTTGSGVELIGGWFGTGPGRGIALVFIISGAIGLIVTLLAFRSNAYKLLTNSYLKK